MKFVKIILAILLIVCVTIFIKVKFFNPFNQDVTITSQSGESAETGKLDKLVLAGPFATVSHPLIHMVNSGALADVANEVEFRLWKDPDQLRAMVLNGQVHFVALPTNVAANLYNKEVNVRLVNVSIWGILGMITRDETLKTLKDFKGKEIIVPFRSDMPDIILKQLIESQGMSVDNDFSLRYVATPIDAMQMLLMRRADHVLLAEPAISMALRKSGSFPLKAVAPTLYRSSDLQQEWGKTFNVESKLPQAGMAVLGDVDAKIINRFNEEYQKSLAWYKNNPQKAGVEVAKVLPMLEAKAVADSIPFVNLKSVDAVDSRVDLEHFFGVLLKSEPKLIGGKIPDDGFYYKSNE